jgi:diguanylate cyclase (GGDEF)-like protein
MVFSSRDDLPERLLAFIDQTPDIVGVCNEQGRVMYLNAAAIKELGVGADIDNLTTADFFAPEAFVTYYDEVRPVLLRSGSWTGELAIRTRSGESRPMLFTVVARLGAAGEIAGLVTYGRPFPAVSRDSVVGPESRSAEIVDRSEGEDVVAAALARARQHGLRAAIIHAEILEFASLFERLGPFATDGVARSVARRMTTVVRATDTVTRIGRNAYLVVVENLRDVAEALRISHALQDAFIREPIWTAAGDVDVAMAIGVAITDGHDDAGETIAKAASAAVFRADLDPSHVGLSDDRQPPVTVALEALRLAVTRQELRTYVEPVMNTAGRCVAYAAKSVWPAIDEISPGTALSELARLAQVELPIALRVLREASAYVMTSSSDGPLDVFVDMPQRLLRDVYLGQYLLEIWDAVGLAPERLGLVIDSRTVFADAQRSLVQSLCDTGAQVVVADIDDRSDVHAIVRRQGVNALVLAQELVHRLEHEPLGTILGRITQVAHKFGIRVIAPGVQSAAQDAALTHAGVDLRFGDFFGPPTAIETVT